MNSFLLRRNFSSSLLKEIKLTKREMKEINHFLKEPYVKKGWHRVVYENTYQFRLAHGFSFQQELLSG